MKKFKFEKPEVAMVTDGNICSVISTADCMYVDSCAQNRIWLFKFTNPKVKFSEELGYFGTVSEGGTIPYLGVGRVIGYDIHYVPKARRNLIALGVLHDLHCEVILPYNSRPVLATRDGVHFYGVYDSNTPYIETNLIVDLVRNHGYCRQPKKRTAGDIHSIADDCTAMDDMSTPVVFHEEHHQLDQDVIDDAASREMIDEQSIDTDDDDKECDAPVIGYIGTDNLTHQSDSKMTVVAENEETQLIPEVIEVVVHKVMTGQLDRQNDSSIEPSGLVIASYDSDHVHTKTPRMTQIN